MENKTFFYHGISMRGTLYRGDCIRVTSVKFSDLRPGDLVVYRNTDTPDGKVVHRIVRIIPGGLIARGDFNAKADLNVVLEEAIIGRVTHIERRGKTHRVRQGRWGLWRGRWLYWWNPKRIQIKGFVVRRIFPLGRWFYRWLRESGIVTRLWHPSIVKVQLEGEQGPLVKFVVKGTRTVAYWSPGMKRFSCRKPYDLIIRRPEQ
jgi:hypothetical protein